MLDIKLIRDNPQVLKDALKNRNNNMDIDALLDMDRKWRGLNSEAEELKRKRNISSEEMAMLVKEKHDISEKRIELKALSQKTKEIDDKVGAVRGEIDKILIEIPNIPHESVPVG
ncbi:MAG: serine--tRNA ligase, partial [Candidatus Omnitrophica bacterium]|nr:serine--tRNA ligase [Candidatus Omnitrophota bacterium]